MSGKKEVGVRIKDRCIEHRCIALFLIGFLLMSFYLPVPVAAEERMDDFTFSEFDLVVKLLQDNFIDKTITIRNTRNSQADLFFSVEEQYKDIVRLGTEKVSLPPGGTGQFNVTFIGEPGKEVYEFDIKIKGDLFADMPVKVYVNSGKRLPVEVLYLEETPLDKYINRNSPMKYKIDMHNLVTGTPFNVSLSYNLLHDPTNFSFAAENEERPILLETTKTLVKSFKTNNSMPLGDYHLIITAEFLNLSLTSDAVVVLRQPFYHYKIFGFFPVWVFLPLLLAIGGGIAAYFIIRKRMEAKKKYHSQLEYNLTPQPGPRCINVGKIAETTKNAFIDIDRLTTHCIVAGSTGGGKTVAAQDIIEECLDKGIAVITFDPTAQWTGMLRKQDNKKMLSLYPMYGMNPKKDPKAYSGNIKPITNALQKIRLTEYIKPGEIQVFTTNTLDPKDIDLFVANTVREIFHSNLQETQELRAMLVYDEVHRLLAKFGGSGEGFIQIERACREFRKWGIGVMLISQVLADFVGQIKANINTEVQMRTRDESDLERIKTKYGGEVLQGLVKASTGTGMIENPEWNRGRPYFISFRPLKHNIKRLSDEELGLYQKYNDMIDQLNFEIRQLKDLNVDVYDLELEIKLALDKIKSGNFNITQIYLDELKPRLEKIWQGMGKTPKKFEIELVNRQEIEADLKAAKKAKVEAEKANAPTAITGTTDAGSASEPAPSAEALPQEAIAEIQKPEIQQPNENEKEAKPNLDNSGEKKSETSEEAKEDDKDKQPNDNKGQPPIHGADTTPRNNNNNNEDMYNEISRLVQEATNYISKKDKQGASGAYEKIRQAYKKLSS